MKTRKKPTFNPQVIAKYSHSTHAPYKCKDCDYHAKTPAALNMHWNRKHGLIVVPNQELKHKTDEELIPNGFALSTIEPEVSPYTGKPKRKWTRRQQQQEQPTQQQFKQVNFCPCCGTNIQAVSVALSLS
jgi:hypothetical protein